MNDLRIAFRHGLGDCVHFAHLLQLYRNRGWDVDVQIEDNKQTLWEMTGLRFSTDRTYPAHGWGYPGDFDDLRYPDSLKNKIAHNLNAAPLPPIGGCDRETLWRELCEIEIDARPFIRTESRAQAAAFLDGLPSPMVLFHPHGNTWQDRKNLSEEVSLDVQRRLVHSGCSVVILDWDDRTAQLAGERIRNVRTWGRIDQNQLAALMEASQLLIGVDTGTLHFARLMQISVLGVWRSLLPCRCSLPSRRAVNLVSAQLYPHWNCREEKWRLAYFDGECSAAAIVRCADDILRSPSVAPIMRAGGRYRYERVGHDRRMLGLCADGTIGEGSAERERYWIQVEDVLTIHGDQGPTCRLWRQSPTPTRWEGAWLVAEKMPVVLEKEESCAE